MINARPTHSRRARHPQHTPHHAPLLIFFILFSFLFWLSCPAACVRPASPAPARRTNRAGTAARRAVRHRATRSARLGLPHFHRRRLSRCSYRCHLHCHGLQILYGACFGVFLVSYEVCVRGQFCLENAFARAQSLKFSSARDEAALAKNLSLRGDRARKGPIIFAAPGTAQKFYILVKMRKKMLSALAGCYAHAWRHRSSLCSMQTNLEKSRGANIFSGSRAGE